MKYCPNRSCWHARSTGQQAEYRDDITSCRDCGTALRSQPGFVKHDPSANLVESLPESPVESLSTDDAVVERAKGARLDVVTGAFLIVGSALAWFLASELTDSGGSYTVMLGPLGYGVFRLVRGLGARRPQPAPRKQA